MMIFFLLKINEVIFPPSLESIGAYAFDNNKLTSLTIHFNVVEIGEGAFANNGDTSDSNDILNFEPGEVPDQDRAIYGGNNGWVKIPKSMRYGNC